MVIMDLHAMLVVGDPDTVGLHASLATACTAGTAFVGVHRLATFIQLY